MTPDNKYNQVTLLNCDIGKHCIRSNSISAYSMDNIAPALSDHTYFCSTANARLSSKGSILSNRRYLGFTRAKITDYSSYVEYDTFNNWIKEVALILNSSTTKYSGLLNRYAEYVDIPNDTRPVNILIDLGDVIEEFRDSSSKKEIKIEDLCCEVKSGKFELYVNKTKYEVEIFYDSKKKKYELTSSDLEKKFSRDSLASNTKENIIAYLNRTQSFRIITATENVVYAYFSFYSPRLNIIGRANNNKLDIFNVIYSFTEIKSRKSEKGGAKLKVSKGLWHEDSLFGLVARQAANQDPRLINHFGFDILICADMGTEEADFIGADTINNRIAFIHLKAMKEKKLLSASVFQEVCSQLIKNLNCVSPYSENDLNYKKWDNIWRNSKIGKVKRIITGNGNGQALYDKIKKIILNPNSEKEVWIMLGNGFDADLLKKNLAGNKLEAEYLQILYLLTTTWNATTQVGAKLKIFC